MHRSLQTHSCYVTRAIAGAVQRRIHPYSGDGFDDHGMVGLFPSVEAVPQVHDRVVLIDGGLGMAPMNAQVLSPRIPSHAPIPTGVMIVAAAHASFSANGAHKGAQVMAKVKVPDPSLNACTRT